VTSDASTIEATTGSDRQLTWYRQMLEIRLFEDKVQELFMQGQIEGTTHLCQGHEAVSVGAIAALRDDDYLTITYRGHGHALARGIPMVAAFGELMGRTSGCCGGVGGSMHLTDFSRNLIGAFAIIGAGLSVAVGAAMSAKLRGTNAVALTFCGDGATNIGTFHEALNMASVWKAPAVFVIENNLYGEYSPLRETTPIDDLAERAKAYAMPGVIVDGQDVNAVNAVVEDAVDRARSGAGPTLIEAKTYRYRGHSRTDPAKYRAEGELERWKQRDPIDLLGAKLDAEGILSVDAQRALRAEVQAAVDADAEQAAQAPNPTLKEIEAYVYAG
jgi:acetoin:2,6-dichlorophenolindophenol oxidoreductase subunit alpha